VNNLRYNGVKGEFGSVNILDGTSAELSFSFVLTGTETPIDVANFAFTVYDVDATHEGFNESVKVCGADRASTSYNTTLAKVPAQNCLMYESTVEGGGDNNPEDPKNLTAEQLSNSVTFFFGEARSEFKATLGISGPGFDAGRNFIFALVAIVSCPPPPLPPQLCPKMTQPNTLMAPSQNNLGGRGPGTGAETIVYSKALSVEGQDVDVVLSAKGEYEANNPEQNGVDGEFGNLNIREGTSVDVAIQFVLSGTDTPFEVGDFAFTVYDLDSTLRSNESVTICGAERAVLSEPTNVLAVPAGACRMFQSYVKGTGKNNPDSPRTLTDEQKANSVTYFFTDPVTEFAATFASSGEPKNAGRNFVFAFVPALACPPEPPLCENIGMVEMNPLMTPSHNNLGGKGPDTGAETMVYSNAAMVLEQGIDLVISATNEYVVHNTEYNGVKGEFGSINVKDGTSVDLSFSFVLNGTETPTELGHFAFTVYDIDATHEGFNESVKVCGAETASTSPKTTLAPVPAQDCLMYESTVEGGGENNPGHPKELTPEQVANSVTFFFSKPRSEFKVTLAVSGPGFEAGRNFIFAFVPVVACPPPPMPPPCTEMTEMNALLSPTHNNLGGVGPDSDAETMVYPGALTIDGADVDLVVSASAGYEAHNAQANGVWGEFGAVNLKNGMSVDLSFKFAQTGTDSPVEVGNFAFTVYDLDSTLVANESVTICGASRAATATSTNVVALPADGDCQKFESVELGTGKNNPTNPNSLTSEQMANSVTYFFVDARSEFTVTFAVSGPQSTQGRNFLFALVPVVSCL